ncbi:dual specificity phosphatase catalytic domain-containing protein [Nannizzia gypsea CBS 118893]|uniref:Dual specificity phosphatase catalytic domain-containing protein n=1 Tax=Arthroderma gypseum (strain ATCC MYA-4604 / CBS 118893) TaxID=535722 RepID=E4V0G2_ARTGP|nr:dual specificity phosphatase catalytic domain-containing protein [Nannizzia gypsea CBS 118893]EFR03099.1 dual specificity phosphatase catalytic domain-containing protein [Nannizzia gypsea CBS 118893]
MARFQVPSVGLSACDHLLESIRESCYYQTSRLIHFILDLKDRLDLDRIASFGCYYQISATIVLLLIGGGIISWRLMKHGPDGQRILNSRTISIHTRTKQQPVDPAWINTVLGPKGSRLKRFPPRDDDNDPGILKKHSSYHSYTTSVATYPKIRTFYYPHPHTEKLPTEPKVLPLLVFIHGLGGCLAQFNHLLHSMITIGPCFGIDLPGCGLSTFAPRKWSAYSIEAMAELVANAIEKQRDAARNQDVIIIAHSMGCSVAALIASSDSGAMAEVKKHIVGIVAICPVSEPPDKETVKLSRRLLYIPGFIFDIWRWWDRIGGHYSPSVRRLVSDEADWETHDLQYRYNKLSRTPVWRRMAWGALPRYNKSGQAISGIPGKEVWDKIHIPLFFVGGESDGVTKPKEVLKLLRYFDHKGASGGDTGGASSEIQGDELPTGVLLHSFAQVPETTTSRRIHHENATWLVDPNGTQAVDTYVFPAPASHSLLFDRSTYRTLSGHIQSFVAANIDLRLGLGWQLQHLTTSGKWDVKNLAKWQAVTPVSEPIGRTFVAMKTLREVDPHHSPKPFVEDWRGKIYAVIDISHENPVYDYSQLEVNGIKYFKIPTVSKIPPSVDEVREFFNIVKNLKEEIMSDALRRVGRVNLRNPDLPKIAVHCHYGFNRTGFFIVSWLIEVHNYLISEALEEFERVRPPGIRHEHFIDALHARYHMIDQTRSRREN